MSKTIRFSEIVKQSGRPESVALWTKPKDNPPLMRAVRENRVLTLIQKSMGMSADFGVIGFHQKPSALYLIFPKALPNATDLRVIGIKYDLMAEPTAQELAVHRVTQVRSSQPPKRVPVPKLKAHSMKIFHVTILRTAAQEVKLKVKASNLNEAESRASATAKAQEFVADEIQNQIKAISEK